MLFEVTLFPNIDGVFAVTVLNVTTWDIYVKSRKIMGDIQLTCEILGTNEESSNENVVTLQSGIDVPPDYFFSKNAYHDIPIATPPPPFIKFEHR